MLLGVSAERIHVHLLGKGSNVHSELERHGMAAIQARVLGHL